MLATTNHLLKKNKNKTGTSQDIRIKLSDKKCIIKMLLHTKSYHRKDDFP